MKDKKEYIDQIINFIVKIQASVYWRAIRLNKPAGFLLALIPAIWSVLYSYNDIVQLLYIPLFMIGAVLARGAGCIINDIVDRKYDIKVERTAIRPIASGELPINHAIYYLLILGAGSFLILAMLPKPAIITGLLGVILIAAYPFMKRITDFPQVFLGFVFNLGALIGWFTISSKISITPFILYFAACFWTIGYDTIYAYQDLKDDKEAGVRSMVTRFGDDAVKIIWNLYRFSALLFGLLGIITHMNFLYFLGWGLAFYHLYWQTQTLNTQDPKNCGERWESNVLFGVIMIASIFIGSL